MSGSDEDDHEQFCHLPCTPQKVSYNDQSTESEEDEQVVAIVMHSEDPVDFGEVYHASNVDHKPSVLILQTDNSDNEHSDSDWYTTMRYNLKYTVDTEDTGKLRKCKGKSTHILPKVGRHSESDKEDGLAAGNGPPTLRHGRLPIDALQKAQVLSVCTTQEAQAIANEYGKTLVSIMADAGLTTKATQAESVWNIHQAWYVSANPKLSNESVNDYYSHQMKHYESHKDEGEHPELWAKIWKFWNESINGTKDMSLKVMVQTWSNVEGIHVFGCVIYGGNDEAVHQAQGVFAGSSLCMQLASERQTDVAKLLDFLSMIIKYKILDSAASVLLPNFALLSQKLYDLALALQSQEVRHDQNWYEAEIKCGQKNVPWKVLLDLLFIHKHTIIDWPAGVLVVGPDFNVKCLNTNELHALTVPFLKEQMEQDYNLEAPAEEEEDHFVPVPASLFYLKHWTAAALQPCTPTTTPATDHRSVIKNIQRMEVRMTQAHHREGPIAVLWTLILTFQQAPPHMAIAVELLTNDTLPTLVLPIH
ncbi:hypothetical protein F5J12DRAFT_780852 [Pisolithus orientalis]|uniref:uncharacterized protein n=1 Tax=Pisolithus orientalis TaxID=936130 RepID=UPI002224B39E|nr:uncharacterized protein F5J12DRAFT_780852 [Pisolithus orientalis]KAI6019757.1 hypothetical protein F5J12DRAFT_780852 [Pisolithus orientalis]